MKTFFSSLARGITTFVVGIFIWTVLVFAFIFSLGLILAGLVWLAIENIDSFSLVIFVIDIVVVAVTVYLLRNKKVHAHWKDFWAQIKTNK